MHRPVPSHESNSVLVSSSLHGVLRGAADPLHVPSGPMQKETGRHALAVTEQLMEVQALADHAEGGPASEASAGVRV